MVDDTSGGEAATYKEIQNYYDENGNLVSRRVPYLHDPLAEFKFVAQCDSMHSGPGEEVFVISTNWLAEWLDSRGVSVDEQSVLLGDAVESLSAHVRSKGAALLVCGSRRLSLTERVFLTSAGSELAALAPCPVAVVPPTTGP